MTADNRDVEVGEVCGVKIGFEKQGERRRNRGVRSLKEVGAHKNCEQTRRQTEVERNDVLDVGLFEHTHNY